LRPANFPTIRISQFANFLYLTQAKFFRLLEGSSLSESCSLFNTGASSYWDNHFLFDQPAGGRPKRMGKNSIHLLMINALAGFQFFYGIEKKDPQLREKALSLLEQLPPEINSNLAHWGEAGMNPDDALQSQALIHLKRHYCDKKRCLECRIGEQLLTRGPAD